MADLSISQLNELNTPQVGDYLVMVDGSVVPNETKKVRLSILDARYLLLTGSLADVSNHSHTILTDIGSTTHATIDSYLDQSVKQAASPTFAGLNLNGDSIGTDFVRTRAGTITRTGDYVSSVVLTGGRTLTVTRDGNNYISTIADGTRTWTYTRNASNQIIAWAVT